MEALAGKRQHYHVPNDRSGTVLQRCLSRCMIRSNCPACRERTQLRLSPENSVWFNLNISRYADTSEDDERTDVAEVVHKLRGWSAHRLRRR